LQPESVVREHIGRKLVPGSLVQHFEEVRQTLAQSLDRLETELNQFDRTLARALERSRSKMMYQLSKMEAKTEREALRRDDRAEQDARYLMRLVYPEKHLQERYYSILPFLAEHGPGLLDLIYDHVNLECPDHKVLVV
jgi:uncharacterized protein YllA (UPF0747 family)